MKVGTPMPLIGAVLHHGSSYTLTVTWKAGIRAGTTDTVHLASIILTHSLYQPLRDNVALLNSVHIIENGYAIAWDDNNAIDMAATTIERLAIDQEVQGGHR